MGTKTRRNLVRAVMMKKRHTVWSAGNLRLSAGTAWAVALFTTVGALAGNNLNLAVEGSSINLYGTEGWSYQLKEKKSLADLSWVEIGDPIWGANEGITIGPTQVAAGFFMVEATYIGVSSGFDFSQKGAYSYTSVVYGSTEPYNRYEKDSTLYDIITSGYEIAHSVKGLSVFLNEEDLFPVPINGLLRVPDKEAGSPPSPLALIVHGMREEFESENGFIYLCEQLASHGIITVAIDEYIFNDDWGAQADGQEIDARAIVLLEHVKQFGIWNETSGHPLEGRVDMENVMLIGHSRGGEAVELASYFQSLGTNTSPIGVEEELHFDGTESNNYLGPYNNFKLQALVALAPTEGNGVNEEPVPPIEGNYLIIQGSADKDVMRFVGYKVYERANPIDLENPRNSADGFKAMVWIHGANHVFFNTEWRLWQADPVAIDPNLQRKMTKYYITAFAHSTLLEDDQAVKVFQNNRIGDEWFVMEDEEENDVPIKRATQYQGREYLFINHYQEDEDSQTLSSSLAGVIGENSWGHASLTEEKFSSVAMKISDSVHETDNCAAYCQPETNSEYTVHLDDPLDVSMFNALSLNIANAQMDLDALDVNIIMIDSGGRSVEFDISKFASLWGPTETRSSTHYLPIAVMQTVFIPFNVIAEANDDFDITALKIIKLNVSDSASGASIYFDNLQFVK